jgi:hypothetical protein
MKAHAHDYADGEYGVQCTHEGCTARGNDGHDTALGQILHGGQWVDYARATMFEAMRWKRADPRNRRVVDWITREEITE